MTLFVVEHHVHDKAGWRKFVDGVIDNAKGKTHEDIANDPSWGGNECPMSIHSVEGDLTVCFWELPESATDEDCHKVVDAFVESSGPAVKNIVHKVDASFGIQNLTFETYCKDMVKCANEGSTLGHAANGDLFYVHHDIPDKAEFDNFFAEKVAPLKGKSTSQDVSDAWEVGMAQSAMYCGLGDKDAVCLWLMPKGTTVDEFKEMIDKFTGSMANNKPYKLDEILSTTRCIHPDFYAQEAIAYANSV